MCKMAHFARNAVSSDDLKIVQHPTAIAETTIAETTTLEDKLSEKTTVLEEIELDLFTAFEDRTALEDRKSLTVFSAIAVVGCKLMKFDNIFFRVTPLTAKMHAVSH